MASSKETLWAEPWGKRFNYARNPAADILPFLDRQKFKRVLMLETTAGGSVPQALTEAGFTVTTDEREAGNAFQLEEILKRYPRDTYDIIIYTCRDRCAANGGALMVFLENGKPFIQYTNLDGLPIAFLRYEYLKKYADRMTLFLCKSRAFVLEGAKKKDLFARYWLGGFLDLPQFIFADTQTDFLDTVDNWG